MFSTMSLCMNILRFYFYNFVSDNKNDKIRDLKDQVENLHNILEEVVRFLNRKPETYDEEKAEFVNTDEAEKDVEPESEEEQKPTNEAKED